MLDEKTGFKAVAPTNSRAQTDVIDRVRRYEGVEEKQPARSWWTDTAPEFRAASRGIRAQRPLAHATRIPHVHQRNGIIERSNHTATEGTNCSLYVDGADAKWWVCAAPHWCTMHNGFTIGPNGTTPWFDRLGADHEFNMYPWGAIGGVKPPAKLGGAKDKFQAKMAPHILVGVGSGPGGIWGNTYSVVPSTKSHGPSTPSMVRS